MKIKVKAKPIPEPTFSITGLTLDEMHFLRDLTGCFADNPGDGGIKNHFHTSLYVLIHTTLREGPHYAKAYKFTGRGSIFHCSRADPSREDQE